jgi:hypothetical protein
MMSDEMKSVREILMEATGGDVRLRDSFSKWLDEQDRKKQPPKKAPVREAGEPEDQARDTG